MPDQIYDGDEFAVFPQQPVRKARDLAHVDVGAHHRADFAHAFKATGTSARTGAKKIAVSRHAGGISSDPPAHCVPRLRAKAWIAILPG